MIKKVSSWVLGSFFRQFGRFLFFLVLGGLVFLLIQHNDINFKWTDLLGIEMVKADSYYASYDESYYYDESKTQPLASGGTFQYDTRRSKQHLADNADFVKYYFNNNINIDHLKGGHITIPFSLETGSIIDDHTTFQSLTCGEWKTTNYGYTCNYWMSTDNKDAIILQPQVSFNVYIEYTSGYVDNCEVDYSKNYFNCPIINATGLNIKSLIVAQKVYYAENYDMYYRLGLGLKFNGWKNDTNTIVENQNQNTQDINNTLTDTNTTSDVSTADSFFNDTNSTSESAIADIVSTPLTLLNNLSVGTFNDICATLNNKQICLPSGDIIWNRQHGGAGVHDHWFRGGSTQAFITFFNLVVGGFILYKCLISLFHVVHKMLDPVNTYVEVMKL